MEVLPPLCREVEPDGMVAVNALVSSCSIFAHEDRAVRVLGVKPVGSGIFSNGSFITPHMITDGWLYGDTRPGEHFPDRENPDVDFGYGDLPERTGGNVDGLFIGCDRSGSSIENRVPEPELACPSGLLHIRGLSPSQREIVMITSIQSSHARAFLSAVLLAILLIPWVAGGANVKAYQLAEHRLHFFG